MINVSIKLVWRTKLEELTEESKKEQLTITNVMRNHKIINSVIILKKKTVQNFSPTPIFKDLEIEIHQRFVLYFQ